MKNAAATWDAAQSDGGFNVGQVLALFRRWWWLLALVTILTVGVTYAVVNRMTPVYRATATVVVSAKPPRVMADIADVVELTDGTRYDFVQYIRTQIDIIKSQDVAAAVLDRLNLWDDRRLFASPEAEAEPVPAQESRRRLASQLGGRIRAQQVPDSLILEIHFEHEDPKLAALIANEVARTYRDLNLDNKKVVLENARTDLEKLLGGRTKSKQAAEQRIREFEAKQNITAVGSRKKEVANEREYYNKKVLEATAALIESDSALVEIDKVQKKGLFGIGVGEVLSNPVLSSLKLQYVTLKNEVSETDLEYGPKHPKLIGAKQRLGQVMSAAGSEIKGIYAAAKAKNEEAKAQKVLYEARFEAARAEDEQLSKAVEEYQKLDKEVKEQTKLFDKIRTRHEETMITQSLAANNVRILNQALVPTVPERPRKMVFMAIASLMGLLLGLGLALVLERADTSIRDKAHAEAVVDVACLGLVPTLHTDGASGNDLAVRRQRDLYVFDHPLSEPAEMARTLRTNILFLSAERKLKTLLVTSALPEEGKTTIAIQASIALAAAGSRTILIEADMRRPRLARTLEVAENVGLSTFLANRDADVQDVIQKTRVPDLDVIVCGLIPPNPAELLNSLRLNQLIVKLHEHYDMVIFDSPPVNAVSDALVMASRVDGVLLVAKCKRTTTEALKAAYRSLLNVDAPVMGTVLNELTHGKFGYYKGRYYRGKYYRRGYYRHANDEVDEETPDKAGEAS